jgi:CBS domain-containing protein
MELLQRFKVRDVMKRTVISISRDTSMREAQRIMRENRISGVPVSEDGRLFGIVSVNDIINALDNGWIDDKCEDHMASNLVVLEAGMPLAYALRYFNNYTYGRFPVLDASRKLVGIISQRDVMKALLYELSVEIRKLERKAARASSSAPEHATSENYFRKEFAVVRNDLGSAGRAANEIKQILKDRKIDRTVARRVAIAAYELEINVCIHSHGGILTFILDDNTITIKTKDRGPGIADIEWACRDGASTANDWIRSMGFGAGMGLPNSKRVSDEFDIESEVGKYTKVTCKFKLAETKNT